MDDDSWQREPNESLDESGPSRQTNGGRPGKRKRLTYSCTECSKCKVKCNRKHPCARCEDRGISHLCRYPVDGYENPVELHKSIVDRLDRIEAILARQDRRRSRSPPVRGGPASPPTAEYAPEIHVDDPSVSPQLTGFVRHGVYYGPAATSQVDNEAAGEVMRALRLPSSTRQRDQPDSQRMPRPLGELLHDLPPKPVCDALVRQYFDEINLNRYPIPRQSFEETYDALWRAMSTLQLPTPVLHSLPLIFIVLAISALTGDAGYEHTRTALTKEDRLTRGDELYRASRKTASILDTERGEKGDLSRVMADVLTIRYMILVRRAPDAIPLLGTTIFRAQALGLHRHGRVTGRSSEAEDQERRLLWSYVYHLDRSLALLLGHPLGIEDRASDADPPSNLADDFSPRSLDQVTHSSFLVHRHALARITGRIASEAYALVEPPYEVVASIDRALLEWLNTVPPPLSPLIHGEREPTTRASDPVIRIHRYHLTIEYNFARLSLHRPYLTRKGGKYELSRQSCLDAAMADLWARSVWRPPSIDSFSMGSYRVANSILILAVSLVLFTSPQRTRAIRECLASFATARQADIDLLSEDKLREMAMVELLQNKADQTLDRLEQPPLAPSTTQSAVSHATAQDQSTTLDPNFSAWLDGVFANPLTASNYFNDQAVPSQMISGDSQVNWDDLSAFLQNIQ